MSRPQSPIADRQSETPQPVDAEPGHFRIGTWCNISFLTWAKPATVDAVARIGRVTRVLGESYPGGHSNVSFVMPGIAPPDDDTRKALSGRFRSQQLKCVSTIIEGDGFWASTLRSTMTGIRLDAASALAMALHSSIEEAVAWLPSEHQRRTGVALDPMKLAAALRAFRAAQV